MEKHAVTKHIGPPQAVRTASVSSIFGVYICVCVYGVYCVDTVGPKRC